jgi:trehalose 6-phosphate synthase
MARVVAVSNRIALSGSAGGLAVGVKSALEAAGGLWFGWSGETGETTGNLQTQDAGAFRVATVDLSQEDHHRYYEGYANRSLWPTLHNRLDLATFDPDDEAAYRRVNAAFADHLAPLIEPGDLIWVHDYHLVFLGRELRARGIDQPIGYFLHTPFPPAEVMAAVPHFADLTDALATYDLVGFQSRRDLLNFRDLLVNDLGATPSDGRLRLGGKTFAADVFPIGIDTEEVAGVAASEESLAQGRELTGQFGDRQILIGADRLDYTKGLVERFHAFERLLDDHPDLHRRIVLLQLAAPSREGVPEYQAMRERIETLAGHVNGRFSDVDWVPIHYTYRTIDRPRISALFRLSRVGLVTPLRDGMNLVAKEFAAAQDPEDPGVLVLSKFAGSAELLEGPLLVSPYDTGEVAETMARALAMPPEERRERWRALMQDLSRHDIHHWQKTFLEALQWQKAGTMAGA